MKAHIGRWWVCQGTPFAHWQDQEWVIGFLPNSWGGAENVVDCFGKQDPGLDWPKRALLMALILTSSSINSASSFVFPGNLIFMSLKMSRVSLVSVSSCSFVFWCSRVSPWGRTKCNEIQLSEQRPMTIFQRPETLQSHRYSLQTLLLIKIRGSRRFIQRHDGQIPTLGTWCCMQKI